MSRSRNAKCSCGSGKKYKLCHGKREPRERERTSNRVMFILGMFVVIAIVAMGGYALFSGESAGDGTGRVWSTEHNHWHDVGGGELPGSSSPAPGPAPAGKVWSPEHNHWH